MQTGGSSLTIPVILWGNKCPTHCISSIIVSPLRDAVITGSHDGQICLWNMKDGSLKVSPSKFFLGHTKAVKCLTWLTSAARGFISSSESGEMCVWDLNDSCCVEAASSSFIHTSIQTYTLAGRRSPHLFCNGLYPEILVYDANTLAIQFRLVSKLNSDWITSVVLIKPSSAPDDVVIGLSISGSMKVWTIAQDFRSTGKEIIYEHESKQIRVHGAWTLRACPTYPRTMLIVSPTSWHIYDAKDFSVLCSLNAPKGVRWTSGDFIAADRVLIHGSNGNSYLFRLPLNSVAGGQGFRIGSTDLVPLCLGILRIPSTTPLPCQPCWTVLRKTDGTTAPQTILTDIILRGDAKGLVAGWIIPDELDRNPAQEIENAPEVTPIDWASLEADWDRLTRRLPGVVDRTDFEDGATLKIVSSLFVPLNGRMFLGMEDGSIIMLPALQKLSAQMFSSKKTGSDFPVYRFLRGHEGKVTALLYPHQDDNRYDAGTLVSGGVDFTVRVWDLYQCQLQHTFVCQAGEILSLMTPPPSCNNSAHRSICSVASDHSVALLSLNKRRPILMASRHVFPVQAVKWRPMDDFLLVQCTDGTVYVWQIETGHLDRVVIGGAAEEIIQACDEEYGMESGMNEEIGTNSTLQLLRAIKHRNVVAFRQAAKQGLRSLAGGGADGTGQNVDPWSKVFLGNPLTIQPVRSNPSDQENHLLIFDIEALIFHLMVDESRNDAAESAKLTPRMESRPGSAVPAGSTISETSGNRTLKPIAMATEGMSMAMEVAQVLMSFLHAWGLDSELDRLCVEKLGMTQPKQAVNYGIISKTGFITLLLPTNLHRRKSIDLPQPQERIRDVLATITRYHYSTSSTLTTMHLIGLVAVANTLMNIQNATFLLDHEKRRKIHRKLVRMDTKAAMSAGVPDAAPVGGYSTSDDAKSFLEQQAEVKQAWSHLTAMHCCALSEKLGQDFRAPDIEILVKRWQDRCIEIRSACQALVLSELRRLGGSGRRRLIDQWSVYLPNLPDVEKSVYEVRPAPVIPDTPAPDAPADEDSDFEEIQHPIAQIDPNLPYVFSVEYRRRQSIAILLLGIIGADFGAETQEPHPRSPSHVARRDNQEMLSVTEPMIRSVAKSLSHIIVNPDERLQPFSSLRRSAVDLMGRGFAVWEPFLDVGQTLLALLRLTLDGSLVNYATSAPLPPQSDMARTARRALEQIASVRPPVFITVANMEITRHNSLLQTAQTININLSNAVIVRAKDELLRIVEMLIAKHPQAVADLIVEVLDIVIHCLDSTRVKTYGFVESFPPISRFPSVSYNRTDRRIAAGSKRGNIHIYDLRGAKSQSYSAHSQPVSACEFSPDGRYLATFSFREGKLIFWQIGASFLGLGSSQPKCIKTSAAKIAVLKNWPDLADMPDYKVCRLRWIGTTKFVLVVLANGKEEKFAV